MLAESEKPVCIMYFGIQAMEEPIHSLAFFAVEEENLMAGVADTIEDLIDDSWISYKNGFVMFQLDNKKG